MARALIVAVGGALGSLSRYLVQGWIVGRTGPGILALFVINITGSFAIGLIVTLAAERHLISPDVRLLLTTGFLGGYTTFSSWMFESVQLAQGGDFVRAALNVVGSVVVGIIAAYGGILAARAI